jgi:hydroxymethylpyrimidine/phosphomethylpyrimidine kinase
MNLATQHAGPTALTVAGFDPSSGAGITADLAVFAAHSIFATSAITALTVQSTVGVRRVEPVTADILAETLACLEDDLPADGIKIGMLGGESQTAVVVEYLQGLKRPLPVVLDPVLQSSSGAALLSEAGLKRLQQDLLPLVTVVTPNAIELSILTGMPCDTTDAIRAACETLASRYPGLAVLCTSGDRPKPDDLLLHTGVWTVLAGEHIATRATHGTGCALSSALLCGLLQRHDLPSAAAAAKIYVAQAMVRATQRGAGRGPMNLLWPISQHDHH